MTATLETDPTVKRMLTGESPPMPPDIIVEDGDHLPDPGVVRVTMNVREDTWDAIRDITQVIEQNTQQPRTVGQVVNRLLKEAVEIREMLTEQKLTDSGAKLIIESTRGRTIISNSFFELGLAETKSPEKEG